MSQIREPVRGQSDSWLEPHRAISVGAANNWSKKCDSAQALTSPRKGESAGETKHYSPRGRSIKSSVRK
jgi:hypothetical protein